jgi:hypothetical protein
MPASLALRWSEHDASGRRFSTRLDCRFATRRRTPRLCHHRVCIRSWRRRQAVAHTSAPSRVGRTEANPMAVVVGVSVLGAVLDLPGIFRTS